MSHWDDVPDRWFVALGGRTGPADGHRFDVVSLVVAERDDIASLGLEEAAIINHCATPTAVAELSALIGMPLGAVCVLLSGLLDRGHVTVRNPHSHVTEPSTAASPLRWQAPEISDLERVLVGLRNL